MPATLGMSKILLTLETYLPTLGVALPELTNHNIIKELEEVEGPLVEGSGHAWKAALIFCFFAHF